MRLNNGAFDGKRLWKSQILESVLKRLNYLISPRSLPQSQTPVIVLDSLQLFLNLWDLYFSKRLLNNLKL